MKITWDERKRAENLKNRKLDFADVERFDWDSALVTETYQGKRGERRFKAIGMLDGQAVAVIYSPLGSEAIQVISLRPASRKERKLYAAR